MDLLNREKLRALIDERGGRCVSLYMPTHRAGPETQQDPIRFKNLLRQAEERLKKQGLRSADVQATLGPAQRLLDDASFWQHQSDGLAVFVSRDTFRCYRLPFAFSELVVVTDRFHIKLLLPLLSGDGQFYVLALSKKQVRLLQGTRHSVGELNLENVPTSLAEALGDEEREKQLQFHTVARGAAAIFHGSGGASDESTHKKDLLRYFKQVDKGLQDLLRGQTAPLVLAGVEYLLSIYREANTYSQLMEGWIVGNPDGLTAQELHGQAWAIVQPYFARAQEQAVAQYRELAGTGRTSIDLERILPAAHHGRVDSLFVALGVQKWGKFDAATGGVELHTERQPGDQDLLDLAAMQTFASAGNVYAVYPEQVPGGERYSPVAAVFRY
jgi:hypothetical protein